MIVLRPSPIHGVGVFTTMAIPKGSSRELFFEDDWRFIRKPTGARLAMCKHFGVFDGEGYHTAKNWKCMSVGWYLNHSDKPNTVLKERHITTVRQIKKNEELTIDYATLGEPNE